MLSLSSLEVKVAKLRQRAFLCDQLEAEVSTLRAEVTELRKEICHLRDQNAVAQAEIKKRGDLLTATRERYESSTSWRITGPLRWLIAQMRGHTESEPASEAGVSVLSEKAELQHELAPSHPASTPPNASEQNRFNYQNWVLRYDMEATRSDIVPSDVEVQISNSNRSPVFSFVSVLNPNALNCEVISKLGFMLEELNAQRYPRWEWIILITEPHGDDVKTWTHAHNDTRVRICLNEFHSLWDGLNLGLAAAVGDWIALLDDNTRLRSHSLATIVRRLQESPDAAVIYTDDDDLDEQGIRCSPRFRCDANPDMLLATDYLGPFVCFRKAAVQQCGGFDGSYSGASRHELLLRLHFNQEGDRALLHVPGVLSHRLVSYHNGAPKTGCFQSWEEDVDNAYVVRAVADNLSRVCKTASVKPHPELVGACHVTWTLPPTPPRVGIVIPTRDNVGVLSVCLDSLLGNSSYPDLRVVVVDNGSQQPETLAYLGSLDNPRVKVLRDEGAFNFSRLINLGVAAVEGEILCLLNNDMQITQPDWLEEMVGWALQDEVAAVGARLWYGEGTLQHAGIVLGIQGVAGHVHKFLEKGQPGYLNRALLHQSMSAVTGACMVVRRSVFDAIGGFDERLGVAYNDVDFCLRARRAGWRTVWTPHAEMIHHESISRGFEDTPEKQARLERESALMRERWGPWLDSDPAYSPYLTLEHEDCGLAWPPRVTDPYITTTL